jgi:hypothetical protein
MCGVDFILCDKKTGLFFADAVVEKAAVVHIVVATIPQKALMFCDEIAARRAAEMVKASGFDGFDWRAVAWQKR